LGSQDKGYAIEGFDGFGNIKALLVGNMFVL
jgi:hypothetical protein